MRSSGGPTRCDQVPEHYQVWAEIHTDNRTFEVKFEATRYFEEASDSTLEALIRSGYRGSENSDAVGLWVADKDTRVKDLFDYLYVLNRNRHRATEDVGFEVVVDDRQARQWLKVNRPTLYAIDQIVNN